MSAYAYLEENTVIIGNDFIERRFDTKNGHLTTAELINKRTSPQTVLKLKSFSAEFFIGFRVKKSIGWGTQFLSSNDLKLQSVNTYKRRVEFVFEPYRFSGAEITFIVSVEIEDDKHYMRKFIEVMIPLESQHLVTIDYIDCEHLCFDESEAHWSVPKMKKAYLSEYHSALGQPFYIDGMFFGSEFPLAENKIKDSTGYIRYFCGKRFDTLNLNCSHTFKTHATVAGAGESAEFSGVQNGFFDYIRDIARDTYPRFQYNSWYDNMLNITEENIEKSFYEVEKNLSKALVPPLDSYVVDDGFADYTAPFWQFNEKFPQGFSKVSRFVRAFSSDFGLWLGPRGGYGPHTPRFGLKMEKAGTGGYNVKANDVCVASRDYIKNVRDYLVDMTEKYGINYWKLDGFLLKACPSKRHGHINGGFMDMYQYTEAWEGWIDIFKKLHIVREKNGRDMWINQTSYCNASPWFLQWANSLWMQNSDDMGKIEITDKNSDLTLSDADSLLTYRDSRYYDFFRVRNYQFPAEYLYNHDPIYGNEAKISMSDSNFRKYLFFMSARGNAFWELYYSYNMLNSAKWRINSDAIRFVRENFEILRKSKMFGGNPENGEIYGYSAWQTDRGIAALRNPSPRKITYRLNLNAEIFAPETANNLTAYYILPYDNGKIEGEFNLGDSIDLNLEPYEAVIIKFDNSLNLPPKLLYSRFENDKELLLFFDSRVYLDKNCIECNGEISSIRLLEDYSTVALTFLKPQNSASGKITVANATGESDTVGFTADFYKDFECDENIIPNDRDFTVSGVLEKLENNSFIYLENAVNAGISHGEYFLRLNDRREKSGVQAGENDKIHLVCEPNGLIKLYVNGKLCCSVYEKEMSFEFKGAEPNFGDCFRHTKTLSKALSYDEIKKRD